MFSNRRPFGRLPKFYTVLALFFCLNATVHSEIAGNIVEAIGDVRLVGTPVKVGGVVQVGDSLSTGGDGYVYLKTIDGGFLILRPNSNAKVVAYHVDSTQPSNTRIKIELLHGVARSISGEAVKNARENFRFNTPVAAIGVRGTDFTVFASDETTRVIVVSGGVVVSGFGDGCAREGGGPCVGDARHELFASQVGQVLQVNRGQIEPQLLRNNTLSPDVGAPPRGDEPGGPAGKRSESHGGTAKGFNSSDEVSLLPQKLESLGQRLNVAVPVLATSAPAQEAAPTSPAIVWGRWQALAGSPADIDPAKLSAEYKRMAMDSYFALFRARGDTWQAPAAGAVSFSLQGAQALVQNNSLGVISAAGVENGKLTVDFGSSKFATQFDIVTQGQRIPRQAEGNVFKDGSFGNASQFLGNNNMVVQGVMANDPGLKAAYLFQSRIDDNRVVSGVTSWSK
jgi:hypothetical protein